MLTLTIEQQKQLGEFKARIEAKYKADHDDGIHVRLWQLSHIVGSLNNANDNIHCEAGQKYVDAALGYLEECTTNWRPHHLKATDDLLA